MNPETSSPIPETSRVVTSTLLASGELRVMLGTQPVRPPAADEVLVRVEAAPINPSDIGQLFAVGDPQLARQTVCDGEPALTLQIPAAAMPSLALRVGHALPTGNEGAGTVVAAGTSAEAQALLGRTVALVGGGMYAEFRLAKAAECLLLPAGTTAQAGASCFVNPLTALGFTETARREGHSALVHTAAASNLGRMLNRLCLADGLQLVNIVRSPEQAALLRAEGAVHVVDSSAPAFLPDLTQALEATGASLAFDAIGGGRMASDILACMEVAAVRRMSEFSRYGSTTHKHVYIYGGLDTGPVQLMQNFGKAWSVGAWLLTTFLQGIDADRARQLRARVAAEVATTFASHYDRPLSLAQVLQPEHVAAYAARRTGRKYLVCPGSAA